MNAPSDRAVRAITDDAAFRVIVACTTATVRQAFAVQGVDRDTARYFGDLLTGTVLLRETMSPYYRVQGILKGAGGRGSLVVDTHPDGGTRGLVQRPKGSEAHWIGAGSVLQVMRSAPSGGGYRGLVQPPENGDVSAALMTYLQESEQVVAVIGTGMILDAETTVTAAGGYVVQLLPGAPRGALMIMTERLERFPRMDVLLDDTGGSPDRLLDEILYGMPFTRLEERPISYKCQCSQRAVVASLATLGRAELADILREQEVIEVCCDYCNTTYRIGRTQLVGLMQSS